MIRIQLQSDELTERVQELTESLGRVDKTFNALTENMWEWYATYLRAHGYTDTEVRVIIVSMIKEIANPPTD